MGFIPVKQFQMQVAPGFVGERLEKLPRQPEPEGRGHILPFLRSGQRGVGEILGNPPDQIRPPAEINHAPGQAFVHGHIRLARERIPRMKSRAVAADAFLVPQRLAEGLAQHQPAILDGVMRVHREVPLATQGRSITACLANNVSM